MVGGKVMMDRNAPRALTDTAQSGYDETKLVIADWHGKGRNHVAITPRFAITSTPEQLEAAGTLAREHPDLLIQTHLSENDAEIAYTLQTLSRREGLHGCLCALRAADATRRCSDTPSICRTARSDAIAPRQARLPCTARHRICFSAQACLT
jgi:hypothetical protein